MELTIFTSRKDVQNLAGGSSIRIKGYTCYLKEFGVSYQFVAPVRPDYVDPKDYVQFNLSGIVELFTKVHNILSQVTAVRLISYIIKFFLLKNSEIKKLSEISKGTYILSHQNGSIPLFLRLSKGQKYIYDVHGILSLVKEYLHDLSFRKKLLFYLSMLEEKYVYKNADVINATSERMMDFISSNFKTAAEFAIAPEGLLRDDFNNQLDMGKVKQFGEKLGIKQEDKVLFFAGNFKKFGGVHHLVDAFCELANQMKNLKLFLIGVGQMENYIIKKIKAHKLENRFIHIKETKYSLLPYYQQLATLIICPDIENRYNELVLHVKIFDSIASKKPVIATRFKVLEELFGPGNGFIRYSESSSGEELKHTIADSLIEMNWFCPADDEILTEFAYRKNSERLVERYRVLKILH